MEYLWEYLRKTRAPLKIVFLPQTIGALTALISTDFPRQKISADQINQ